MGSQEASREEAQGRTMLANIIKSWIKAQLEVQELGKQLEPRGTQVSWHRQPGEVRGETSARGQGTQKSGR